MTMLPSFSEPAVIGFLSPGSTFSLKVQVNDVLSRQYLSQAAVEVYVNYTKTKTALSGEDGGVLLHIPYHTGMLLTVVACHDGYICTLLPCKTDKMPSMSSVQGVCTLCGCFFFPMLALILKFSSAQTIYSLVIAECHMCTPALQREKRIVGFLFHHEKQPAKTLWFMHTSFRMFSVCARPNVPPPFLHLTLN